MDTIVVRLGGLTCPSHLKGKEVLVLKEIKLKALDASIYKVLYAMPLGPSAAPVANIQVWVPDEWVLFHNKKRAKVMA